MGSGKPLSMLKGNHTKKDNNKMDEYMHNRRNTPAANAATP
jgi:hypothetical protein